MRPTRDHLWAQLALLLLLAAGCYPLRESPVVVDPSEAGRPPDGAGAMPDGGSAPVDGPPQPQPDAVADRPSDPFPDPVPVSDAAMPDRAPDSPPDTPAGGAGASRCPATFAICDGFEKPTLDSAVFGGFSTPGASAFSIDDTRSYRGARSLRLHVEAMTTEPVGVGSGPLSDMALPNPVYVRFFLFLPEDVPRYDSSFVTIDDPQGLWAGWTDHDVTLSGLVTDERAVPGVVAHGRWVCMLVKARTGSDSELSLFVDGSATPVATTSLTMAPVFHRVMFAIDPDGNQTRPVDLWIDEVLVSGTPVGCDD